MNALQEIGGLWLQRQIDKAVQRQIYRERRRGSRYYRLSDICTDTELDELAGDILISVIGELSGVSEAELCERLPGECLIGVYEAAIRQNARRTADTWCRTYHRRRGLATIRLAKDDRELDREDKADATTASLAAGEITGEQYRAIMADIVDPSPLAAGALPGDAERVRRVASTFSHVCKGAIDTLLAISEAVDQTAAAALLGLKPTALQYRLSKIRAFASSLTPPWKRKKAPAVDTTPAEAVDNGADWSRQAVDIQRAVVARSTTLDSLYPALHLSEQREAVDRLPIPTTPEEREAVIGAVRPDTAQPMVTIGWTQRGLWGRKIETPDNTFSRLMAQRSVSTASQSVERAQRSEAQRRDANAAFLDELDKRRESSAARTVRQLTGLTARDFKRAALPIRSIRIKGGRIVPLALYVKRWTPAKYRTDAKTE